MAGTTSDQWLKLRVLGKGSYGTVSLAYPVNSIYGKHFLAVKSADVELSSSLVEEESFLYELRGCPEIIHCYGRDISIENGKCMFNLLLEYAPGGTLSDHIKSAKNRSFGALLELEVSWYTYMLLLGLKHIHNRGFVHCDLKPENILVFPTQDCTLNHLKIADLGLAKKAGSDTSRPILVNGHWYKYRGTPRYSSPESVLLRVHESPMDIWSLGCIVMEMLTGKPAYPESSTSMFQDSLDNLLWRIGFKAEFPKLPDDTNISDRTKDFLRRCFIRNMHERWSADQLLNHPFIVEHVTLLQGLGIVTDHEMVMNDAGPTPWLSSTALFVDPLTVRSATCTDYPAQCHRRPPRSYREALLKGLH